MTIRTALLTGIVRAFDAVGAVNSSDIRVWIRS